MGFWELQSYIEDLERKGIDVVGLKVQLQRKISWPAVALVMTLLGVPFSFSVGRKGAMYGIGAALVIAVAYWVTFTAFEALGNNAVVPPALAAWGPNMLFGMGALYGVLMLDT